LQLNERLQTRLGSLVLQSLHVHLLYNYIVSRHDSVVFFSHQQQLPISLQHIRSRRVISIMSTSEEIKGGRGSIEKIAASVSPPTASSQLKVI
jgi:hypothetical protein